MTVPVKLNLGCGDYHLDSFVNVDQFCEKADVKGRVEELDFEGVDEIVMSHLLEHISWQITVPLLSKIKSWMIPDGKITIEVPDMGQIMKRAIYDQSAEVAIYGIQSAPGEFHLAGFTVEKLIAQMIEAGFLIAGARTFFSEHPARPDFPCLEVIGIVPHLPSLASV